MHLKSFAVALILVLALCLPAHAQTYDLDKFLGTYLGIAQDIVYLKKLTLAKTDDGKVKCGAMLSGFPEDVDLGEVTAETYPHRLSSNVYRNYLANYSSGKVSVLMVVQTSANLPQFINITTYVKYTDGSKPNLYFESCMNKGTEKPAK